MRLVFELGIQVSRLFSLMWVDLIQSIKDLTRKRDCVSGNMDVPLLDQGHQTSALRWDLHAGSSGSKSRRCKCHYTTGLPGIPACRK